MFHGNLKLSLARDRWQSWTKISTPAGSSLTDSTLNVLVTKRSIWLLSDPTDTALDSSQTWCARLSHCNESPHCCTVLFTVVTYNQYFHPEELILSVSHGCKNKYKDVLLLHSRPRAHQCPSQQQEAGLGGSLTHSPDKVTHTSAPSGWRL